MMPMLCRATIYLSVGAASFVLAACGSDSMGEKKQMATEDTGSHQTPPMGAAKVESWLSEGAYKSWACEPGVHEARSPSPHGFNRICSNDVLSAAAGDSGAWPQGAAAVKELYASMTAATPVGYAVYLKTKADSAKGAAWYWYETVPKDSAAPHDDRGVVADGLGDGGPAKTICVGCHAAAGADEAHTPSPGGRDEVYTPVAR